MPSHVRCDWVVVLCCRTQSRVRVIWLSTCDGVFALCRRLLSHVRMTRHALPNALFMNFHWIWIACVHGRQRFTRVDTFSAYTI